MSLIEGLFPKIAPIPIMNARLPQRWLLRAMYVPQKEECHGNRVVTIFPGNAVKNSTAALFILLHYDVPSLHSNWQLRQWKAASTRDTVGALVTSPILREGSLFHPAGFWESCLEKPTLLLQFVFYRLKRRNVSCGKFIYCNSLASSLSIQLFKYTLLAVKWFKAVAIASIK